MAKARVTIECHHCGERTVIDLMEEMSTQRCQKCGMRLSAVNISAKEKRRKRVSGDPMLKRVEDVVETGAQGEVAPRKRKRRRFAASRWRIIKLILLLFLVGILITTTYIVINNPMGIHRRW